MTKRWTSHDWMIHDLVCQGCTVDGKEDYNLDSGFIGIYADAMDYLNQIGMIELRGNEEKFGRGRLAKDLAGAR